MPATAPPYTRQAVMPKNRVSHVIGLNLAIRQMFEAGAGKYQGPAQYLHTIMVCRISASAQSERTKGSNLVFLPTTQTHQFEAVLAELFFAHDQPVEEHL